MPIDNTIALQVKQPDFSNFMSPVQAYGQALSLQQLQANTQLKNMQLQQGMQTLKDQQALSQLAAVPDNIDPATGMLKPAALETSGVSLLARQNLTKAYNDAQYQQANIKWKTSEATATSNKLKTDTLHPIMEEAFSTYEQVLQDNGGPDSPQAVQMATEASNKVQANGLREIAQTGTGGFSKDDPLLLKIRTPQELSAGLISHKERLDRQEKERTASRAEAAQAERERHDRSTETRMAQIAAGGTMQSTIPAQDQDKTGEDFLKTLPSSQQKEVKALVEGRLPVSPYALRSKQMWPLMERAMQYDPTFDASNYNVRLGVRRDFASGPTSKNITAINTAIGHIGTLDELGEALKNKDVKRANQVINVIATETGKPAVNNFNLARSAVGDELMRTFRQVGASETEANAWKQNFDSANSPAQFKGAVKVATELLNSRINALNDTWKRGMNTDKDYANIVSPRSKEVLKKMGVELEVGSTPESSNAPAKQAAIDPPPPMESRVPGETKWRGHTWQADGWH